MVTLVVNSRAPEGWVRISGTLEIEDVEPYRTRIRRFIRGAGNAAQLSLPLGLTLHYVPLHRENPKAVEVKGWWTIADRNTGVSTERSVQIGYTSEAIAEQLYELGQPKLNGQLVFLNSVSETNSAEVHFEIFVPQDNQTSALD